MMVIETKKMYPLVLYSTSCTKKNFFQVRIVTYIQYLSLTVSTRRWTHSQSYDVCVVLVPTRYTTYSKRTILIRKRIKSWWTFITKYGKFSDLLRIAWELQNEIVSQSHVSSSHNMMALSKVSDVTETNSCIPSKNL